MPKTRRVILTVFALIIGFFGGGYLHYYAMLLLQKHTGLQSYSWNDPEQGTVLRFVFFGDFAVGAVLAALAALLIARRGFNVSRSLLLGLGASVMAYPVLGVVLCMLRC